MKNKFLLVFLVMIFSISSYAGLFQTNPRKVVQKATNGMQSLTSGRSYSIPTSLLNSATCVASVRILKLAIGALGGKSGKGVVTCRVGNSWSAPLFVTLGGLSLGWHIGGAFVDTVLVFVGPNSKDYILKNKFKLGVGLDIVIGPNGTDSLIEDEGNNKTIVYSYSVSKGLYAGLLLDGAIMANHNGLNRTVYGNVTNGQIINSNYFDLDEDYQELSKYMENY